MKQKSTFETLWDAYLKRFGEPFSMYEGEFMSEKEAIEIMQKCIREGHPYRVEVKDGGH